MNTDKTSSSRKAYVALDPTGYVEGACAYDSPDAAPWVKAAGRNGSTVRLVTQEQAKAWLFTQVATASWLA